MAEPAAPESVLDRIVARSQRLYTLPAVAARVLEVTQQEQIDPHTLKECVENDPALAAKILRVANSSLFGLRTEVKTLHRAIGLLGIRALKMLVLGFSLPPELTREAPGDALERFWRHSLYRAAAARLMAVRYWQMPGDDAFLAGLLGGVGMLALLQDLGGSYARFLNHVYERDADLTSQELAVLGFDHVVLSARMLEQWGMPESLVRCLTRPAALPQLAALPEPRLAEAAVQHLADLAATFLISGRPARLQALVAAAAQLKGLSSTEVQDFLVTLESEVGGVADLFNLSPPQPGSFHTLIREAQMTLSDLAETAVVEGDAQLAAVLRETNDLQSELRQMVSGRRSKSLRRGDAARPAAPAPQMQIAQGPATLLGRVEMVIQRCRDERAPVSLVLVAVDRFSEVLAEVGPETADAVLRWLAEQCAELAEMPGNVLGAGEAQYAILLPQFDRTSAASASRQLLDQARRKFRQLQGECPRPIKVSLGVATVRLPARNFLARDLIEAARRCLQAAQSSGSDTVKSIEL